jgi:hypothetical protein
VDLLGGILIGIDWLGEHIVTTPAALAGDVCALTMLVIGMVILPRCAAAIRRLDTDRVTDQTGSTR